MALRLVKSTQHKGQPDEFTSLSIENWHEHSSLNLGNWRRNAEGSIEVADYLTPVVIPTLIVATEADAEAHIIKKAREGWAAIGAFLNSHLPRATDITHQPLSCPRCGSAEKVRADDSGAGVSVCCLNCFDGAPDAGRQLIGGGKTEEQAVEDWNEQVRERLAEAADPFVPVNTTPISPEVS